MIDLRKAIEENKNRIFTLCYYYLGQSEDAEEATQDVLVRLWQNRDKLKGGEIKYWLARVTRNACMDTLRRKRKLNTVISGEKGEMIVQQTVDNHPDARSLAESSDLKEQIRCAIAKIDDPYRSLLILREIQEMSYEEITRALDMPLERVKVYLHRARRMLRDLLREKINHENV
jgi:RNA polymerase sigma-70 factor (ECF subfamily)